MNSSKLVHSSSHDQADCEEQESEPASGKERPTPAGLIRIVDEAGALTEAAAGTLAPRLDAGTALDIFHRLVVGRRFDTEATALAKQGRLAVYPPALGQEACQVCPVAAIEDSDWIFPTYRDSVALVARGIAPEEVLSLFRGDWHCGYDPRAWHTAPHCTPLATQCPQAVGFGYAARHRSEDTVVLCYAGDGATSEGDFHEALNFAAVFAAPVIFFIQNNHYAISVPLARQTKAPSLAHRGPGYGIPAVRVDGNDVLAVWAVVRSAADRIRQGGGPELIEAVTYRVGPHTSADDPGRYRDPDEVAEWQRRDPLSRYERYLAKAGLLDEKAREQVDDYADRFAARLRELCASAPAPDPAWLFAHVYAERPQRLQAQEAVIHAESARRAQSSPQSGGDLS